MTKNAITAICISLIVSSCGNDEFRATTSSGASHGEEAGNRQITFSPDMLIGSPNADAGSNVGALRYSFEDGEKIGLFGIPYTEGESEATGMSEITDIPGFHFFNQPLTYNQADGALTTDNGPLFLPNDDNLLIYAYYPYNADGITYDEQYGWVLPWSIDVDRLDATPDYMCSASPAYIDNANIPVRLGQFNHLFGAVAFKIYTNDPDVAASAQVTRMSPQYIIYDRGLISLADGKIIMTDDEPARPTGNDIALNTSVQLATSAEEAEPTLAYILSPGSYFSRRTRVDVTYNGRTFQLLLDKDDMIEVEAGTIINYNFYLRRSVTRAADDKQLIIETNITTQDWNESNQ